jgi:hypothetical protein
VLFILLDFIFKLTNKKICVKKGTRYKQLRKPNSSEDPRRIQSGTTDNYSEVCDFYRKASLLLCCCMYICTCETRRQQVDAWTCTCEVTFLRSLRKLHSIYARVGNSHGDSQLTLNLAGIAGEVAQNASLSMITTLSLSFDGSILQSVNSRNFRIKAGVSNL